MGWKPPFCAPLVYRHTGHLTTETSLLTPVAKKWRWALLPRIGHNWTGETFIFTFIHQRGLLFITCWNSIYSFREPDQNNTTSGQTFLVSAVLHLLFDIDFFHFLHKNLEIINCLCTTPKCHPGKIYSLHSWFLKWPSEKCALLIGTQFSVCRNYLLFTEEREAIPFLFQDLLWGRGFLILEGPREL